MNIDNPPAFGPAGTVHCALVDWLGFLTDHLHGALGAPTTLGLQAATWSKLHTRWPGTTYALGWSVVPQSWAGGLTLAHVGDNTLNVADVWIAPAIRRIFNCRSAIVPGPRMPTMCRRLDGDGTTLAGDCQPVAPRISIASS
jgi:hypothetical protein